MFTTLKILWNSLLMALQELRTNKLRTFLSLLGVTIGIFCIIAVLTLTSSLESNVRNQLQSLGSNVVYVEKWPWGGGDYPWWKYVNRPEPKYSELKTVQEKVQGASSSAFIYSAGNRKIEHGDDYMTGVTMIAVTQGFQKIQELKINDGRYFTPTETSGNGPVIILGATIWDGLFGSPEKAIGQMVNFGGKQLKVIGTMKRYGSSIIDAFDYDNSVLVPYSMARTIVSDRSDNVDPFIMVKASNNISVAQLKDELRGTMRAVRRLKPTEDDNFALNELSMVTDNLNSIFGAITFAGWIIGIFALIVGSFGIANIMFVTVKERTNIIGLKKAIGAKQGVILMEFLLESVMLCLIGGLMGIILVYIGTKIAAGAVSYTIYLSAKNIFIGIFASVFAGVVAGFIPAYIASRLDPVVAIRS